MPTVRKTKMIIISCLILALAHNSAYADAVGATDSVIILKLTSIYKAMKEFYDSNVQVLAEAKAQSDNLKKISQFTKEVEQEYNFVTNFSLQRELNNITDDMAGLSNIDNLDGRSTEDQMRLIRSDIDRRFKHSRNEEDRDKYAQLKSRLENLERIQKIKAEKAEEAKKHSSEEQSEKTNLGSIASSTALLSSLRLAEEQRRLEEELAKDIQKNEFDQLNKDFKEALDDMK